MLRALADTTSHADGVPALTAPTVALALGAAGLYVAARVGAHALIGPRGLGEAKPGMVALGLWMPIAATALMAVLAGPPGDPIGATVAVGVTFASTVAALSLAVGMVALLVPNEAAGPTRRAWPFLLPAALLTWLAGFGGGLNVVHALMIGGLGLIVRGVWLAAERTGDAGDGGSGGAFAASHASAGDAPVRATADGFARAERPALAAEPTGSGGGIGDNVVDYASAPTPRGTSPDLAAPAGGWARQPWFRPAQWVVACALAIAAAWAAVYGTSSLSQTSRVFGATLVAAGGLGPLLTLPLLAAGTDMAQRNRAGDACSVCAGVALLNLFGLLPVLVLFWWARQVLAGTAWPAVPIGFPDKVGLYGTLSHFVTHLPSLPMPVTIWRVDSVVLTVLGFALLPAATGRARLGRLEAAILIVAYAVYLAAVAYLVSRPGGV